jgi:hypothetical protein
MGTQVFLFFYISIIRFRTPVAPLECAGCPGAG